MVIAIIGENCCGKSTLANALHGRVGGEIVTGKDYLRMAKSPAEAASLFQKKLQDAVTGENILYVISEKEHLSLLPKGALRILVTADLELIKSRFTQRMCGNLPAPVAAMLEKKHGCFDHEPHDVHIVAERVQMDAVAEVIRKRAV
jgi:ABC-type uncharacterized transport system ATPase component